jgi:hypothetical protein
MSRRLENIQTGFVDYTQIGEGFNQAFAQGKRIQFAEEDRQRRIQQEEDARMAGGAQLYAGWMDEVNKMENGLDQEARAKFVQKFDEVKTGYRGLQEAISKGVKVGTTAYYELYNQVNAKKKSVLDEIGLVKQLNETTDQIAKNYAAGLITDPAIEQSVKDTRTAVLNGTYKPSMGLVTPQQVVMNSYKPAYSTIKSISSVLPVTISQDADYGKDGKTTVKTQRYIPSFSGSISAIDSFLGNSTPRETMDITNKLNQWKSNPDANKSSNYKYYQTYMNTEGVKADPMSMGVKNPEDFTETDFILMEGLPSKFRPNAKEIETLVTTSQGKNYDTEVITSKFMNKLFSGKDSDIDEVIANISGALKTKGWNISRSGNKVVYQKAKDEYSDGIMGEFDLSGDDMSKANAMDFLNKYMSAIGKGGRSIMNKK